MTRWHFRPVVLGFALVSMCAAPLLRAQTSKRPEAYSLTMISSMVQTTTANVYRNGTKERVDLTVSPGGSNPQEVHQILLFDSQAHAAYAQDPASHACYRTQYPSEETLGNLGYDPFIAFVQAGGSPAKMIPGGKLVGTQTINGLTAKLYETATEKLWWSDVYDLPIKIEMIQSNFPPMVMMEIKRLDTTAPPASFFAAPSGCTETQGKWTEDGFEASGQSTVTLGAVAPKPQASPWAATSSLPTHYTLVDVTNLTEASLFTGQPSTLNIYRDGPRERVDLTIAPWAAQAHREGLRMRFLFDFSAHRAYTTVWNGNVSSCSWIKYVSADAPGAYDPITATPNMMTTLGKQGTWKDLGPETLNGTAAKVEELGGYGMVSAKVWIAQKENFLVKYSAPMPGGKGTLGFEVKKVSFDLPPASVFAAPTGCSETQGEWSATGLNASASETVTVGTPSSAPSPAISAVPVSPPATPEPANLVTNGDFESGNTGFTSGYTYGDVSGPGTYWIGTNASQAPGANADWYNGGDHTTGTGNMLVANGANSATTPVWEEVVPVTPNTTYTFSYWGAEVDHDSNSLPDLQLKINGRSVGSNKFPANSPDNGGSWKNFTVTWNSGSSSRADLALFDLNTDTPWNDFALDDISFGAHPAP